MFRFFRKLRHQLLASKKFHSYLLYAVGEIGLVVIGILMALQIDAWSQQQEENREEYRILTNLRNDLLNDISQLEINKSSAQDRRALIDTLLVVFAKPDEYEINRFLALVYPLFFESHFEVNSGTFDESLASGTIKYIKDDSLRQEVFEYYRDAKLSYSDKNSLKLTYELVLPQFARTLAPSREFVDFLAQKPTHLPGLDLSAIAEDEAFMTMLMLKYGIEEDQIRNWDRFKRMARLLLERTEAYIDK